MVKQSCEKFVATKNIDAKHLKTQNLNACWL